jgi:hypothetical protein
MMDMTLRCMFFGHRLELLGEEIQRCRRCGSTILGGEQAGTPQPLPRPLPRDDWYKPKDRRGASKPDDE